MEDENVIQLLDKYKKMVEAEKYPQLLKSLAGEIEIFKINIAKRKGKLFLELITSEYSDPHTKETALKVNEVIRFLNNRFTH